MKLPIGQKFWCIVCNKPFIYDGASNDTTIFCSIECEKDYRSLDIYG